MIDYDKNNDVIGIEILEPDIFEVFKNGKKIVQKNWEKYPTWGEPVKVSPVKKYDFQDGIKNE